MLGFVRASLQALPGVFGRFELQGPRRGKKGKGRHGKGGAFGAVLTKSRWYVEGIFFPFLSLVYFLGFRFFLSFNLSGLPACVDVDLPLTHRQKK